MVADLVGDHVGLGEIAGGAEAPFELVVEAQVDIELVVSGAVEGAHGRAGHPAGRPDLAREDDQVRFLVLAADRRKHRVPGVLGVGQDHRHEIHHLVLSGRRWAGAGRGRRSAIHGQLLHKLRRITAEQQIENSNDQEPDAANTANGSAPTHRQPPSILDVLTLSSAFPTHSTPPEDGGDMLHQPAGRAGGCWMQGVPCVNHSSPRRASWTARVHIQAPPNRGGSEGGPRPTLLRTRLSSGLVGWALAHLQSCNPHPESCIREVDYFKVGI